MSHPLMDLKEALDRRFKSRTAKCALLVGLYFLLHVSVSVHTQFKALDEPMFYFTLVMMGWTIGEPWIGRILARSRMR